MSEQDTGAPPLERPTQDAPRKGWPKGKPRGPRASSEATPKPVVQVTSRRNAALARRLAPGANPHASGTKDIPLKDKGRWKLYLANDYAGGDELYRMRHEMGWEPLELSDLACKPEEIGYRVNEDGHLVRGPQGREVLFKMAIEDYRVLEMRKTELNNRGIGSASKTKSIAAEAAASTFGPEAGDYVHKHVVGTVTDSREALP